MPKRDYPVSCRDTVYSISGKWRDTYTLCPQFQVYIDVIKHETWSMKPCSSAALSIRYLLLLYNRAVSATFMTLELIVTVYMYVSVAENELLQASIKFSRSTEIFFCSLTCPF